MRIAIEGPDLSEVNFNEIIFKVCVKKWVGGEDPRAPRPPVWNTGDSLWITVEDKKKFRISFRSTAVAQ